MRWIFPALKSDESYGRLPNGTGDWLTLSQTDAGQKQRQRSSLDHAGYDANRARAGRTEVDGQRNDHGH